MASSSAWRPLVVCTHSIQVLWTNRDNREQVGGSVAGTNHMLGFCLFFRWIAPSCACIRDLCGRLQVAYSIASLVSSVSLYLKVKVLIEQLGAETASAIEVNSVDGFQV